MPESEKQAMSAAWIVMAALGVPIFIGLVVIVISTWNSSTEKGAVLIEVRSPRMVQEGEIVDLTVTVKNNQSDTVTLRSIDIANDFYNGYALQQTTPAAFSRHDGDPFQTFVFDLRIEPGDEVHVTFEMLAVNAGVWTGDMDLQLSAGESTQTKFIRGEITPGSGANPIDDTDPVEIAPPQE